MKQVVSSLQWFLFIISGSIVVPVTVASMYQLETGNAMAFIARTFFVLAVAGLLQIAFGHRLPINEGPAGIWWGIFILYASLGVALYGSHAETLRVLESSLIISGMMFILLSLLGIVDRLARLFTPTVTGTYLLLLAAQLSGSFLKGLLGVDETGKVSIVVAALSTIVIFLSLWMANHPVLRQFNIIVSMIIGWILFRLFGFAPSVHWPEKWFEFPKWFAFGPPRWEWGIVPTAFFVTLLLLTNMLASMKVVESVMKAEKENVGNLSPKRAGFMMGISHIISGLLAAIGSVPISGAAAFIATSKITKRIPFVIACVLIMIMSLFMPAVALFTAMPAAVGYAAIFPMFAGMITLGLKELGQNGGWRKRAEQVCLPLFTGIGMMFVPSEAFASLPPVIASVMSNGLIVGTLLSILLEAMTGKKGATSALK
ncbi:Xanthine/uracil permease [Parageobacillus thermantarcticus]|uniref:Xanthine/uracil permease n=1 Tax=Parageobacillus thermantarcticus TaxID=186116 RepID=A0A1I0TSZ4_9BACL|nr:purine/pyrimidine permease [Parageobacillus thermantarcticus]SFA54106.1 Xanthine/uracil permease [Parageobacillus thermantarcticus]